MAVAVAAVAAIAAADAVTAAADVLSKVLQFLPYSPPQSIDVFLESFQVAAK